MTIIGIAGAIGTGKSFTQLHQALIYVEQKRKQLVTNFEINTTELYKYACMPAYSDSFIKLFFFELKRAGYSIAQLLFPKANIVVPRHKPKLPWVKYLCETGGLIQIPAPKNLQCLLFPNSVACLDEAGILLNSRDFANTPKELLADLAQSRKFGCDLIWCAQFEEQVDKQVRLLTQYWIHCDSVSFYSKQLKRPKLVWKRIYWFKASDYMHWLQNVKDRGSHFKTRFAYSFQYIGGPLTPSDRQLFKVFDSFVRLDKASSSAPPIVTLQKCPLPKDYYWKSLSVYFPERDPFSYKYQSGSNWHCSSSPRAVVPESFPIKGSLFSQCLALAKAKKIRSAPMFKSMNDSQLRKWLLANR